MIDVERIVDQLRRSGFCSIGRLDPVMVAEVRHFFADRPIYRDAHVPQSARNRGELLPQHVVPDCECYCVHTDDALLAPHLLEAGLGLTEVASRYLEVETPYLYSANAFWTRAGTEPARADIQEFHRDADDDRFLALFTYLSDVLTVEDGAHELRGPDGIVRRVLGAAGTSFLADTSHEHRGLKPRTGERGIHWLRWSVHQQPAAYVWDGLRPVQHLALGRRYPVDSRLRQSLSPLVSPP